MNSMTGNITRAVNSINKSVRIKFFEAIVLCPLLVANFEYIANHVKTSILVLKEWSDFHFAPLTVNLAKTILLNTAHSNRPTRAALPKEV